MTDILSTENYDYTLPDDHVAQKPLKQRDESKLLVYSHGDVEHKRFSDLPSHLPEHADLYFNNAKVIPARTFFKRATGAEIEIFILQPADSKDIQAVLQSNQASSWSCMVRNLKKWKDGEVLSCQIQIKLETVEVQANLKSRSDMIVEFAWSTVHSFSEILEALGNIPLPPYIKRDSEESDKEDYQTIYAKNEGAVAAPTAGLHFTNEVEDNLRSKNIGLHYLTLHVGAGTFKPVSCSRIDEHDMHEEHFEVSIETLKSLVHSRCRVAVGTTSLRTLESLYWIGMKLYHHSDEPFRIEQHVAKTEIENSLDYVDAIKVIIDRLKSEGKTVCKASTSIMIYPGYTIRSIQALITNFHLPKSTLIMLIAAFIGDDWRGLYADAIQQNYRFLSYGDSSLLMP